MNSSPKLVIISGIMAMSCGYVGCKMLAGLGVFNEITSEVIGVAIFGTFYVGFYYLLKYLWREQ